MTAYALKKDTSHVAESLALLTGQFSSDARTPNVRNLVRVLATRDQEIENVLWDIINSQLLAGTPTGQVPTGQALNQLGDLVGEPRGTLNDVQYLLWIMVAVRARKSGGRVEDLLQIAQLALGLNAFTYTDWPQKFDLYAPGLTTQLYAQPLAMALRIARPPGIYGVLDWYDAPTVAAVGLPILTLSDSVSGLGGVGFGDASTGTDTCAPIASIALG